MKVKNIEHSFCNSKGSEEITITFGRNFIQKIFGMKDYTIQYICLHGEWINKETRQRVSDQEWFIIESIETYLRYNIDVEKPLTKHKSTRRYTKIRTEHIGVPNM